MTEKEASRRPLGVVSRAGERPGPAFTEAEEGAGRLRSLHVTKRRCQGDEGRGCVRRGGRCEAGAPRKVLARNVSWELSVEAFSEAVRTGYREEQEL